MKVMVKALKGKCDTEKRLAARQRVGGVDRLPTTSLLLGIEEESRNRYPRRYFELLLQIDVDGFKAVWVHFPAINQGKQQVQLLAMNREA